jgi:hypothetical protein
VKSETCLAIAVKGSKKSSLLLLLRFALLLSAFGLASCITADLERRSAIVPRGAAS